MLEEYQAFLQGKWCFDENNTSLTEVDSGLVQEILVAYNYVDEGNASLTELEAVLIQEILATYTLINVAK